MPVKLKLNAAPTRTRRPRPGYRMLRALLVLFLGVLLLGAAIFGIFYYRYQQVVDDRLAAGPLFASVAQIYAAPREVRPGQHISAAAIARELRTAGYNASSQLGTFQLNGNSIFIKPGPESFHSTDGATITTSTDPAANSAAAPATPSSPTVQTITAENGVSLQAYQLEPQLITGLSEDKNRTKRRLVTYQEIPPRMVQAVTAIEDRNFFEHGGINYLRIVKCAFQDIVSHHLTCGASTLTQQLARGFFLSPDKKFTRKFKEMLITFQLEARFNKQQIFEMYANQINLGQRGSFAINGFGEAAQAFFGKPLAQLDTAECALLAGTIQSPNRLNPYRHPERALERRNLVLDSMVETSAISPSEASRAKAEPLHLTPANVEASEAPYFVDLVHEQLVQRIGDQDLAHQSLRIYTSLDPDLQRVASQAVESGMRSVDDLVRKAHKKGDANLTYPQVSLIALNPHTGQVLALVGGRNYGVSQLNHATAKRPTGSIFKPFVYAAAYNSSLQGTTLGDGSVFTATTMLNDVPTTFTFDNGRQTYDPRDYKNEYHGSVTAAFALAHSLNNATISLGQQVGFENVAALARASGITAARGTPAVSLGAYDATPLDMAGAYTVFANNGVHINPWLLASVRNPNGDIVSDFSPDAKQILDPRTAYLTTSLLEGVMNNGYGIAARQHGFTAPAAGKTGTSHDAWFAGYTSNLICIVWIGNDDYTDVKLSGALAAAPIWAEFMKLAQRLPQYSDMKEFPPAEGTTVVRLDRTTSLLSDPTCPAAYTAAFLDGTAPVNTCSHMGTDTRTLVQKLFGLGGNPTPSADPGQTTQSLAPARTAPDGNTPDPTPADPQKKKGFFRKLFGGGDRPINPPNPPPAPPPPPQ